MSVFGNIVKTCKYIDDELFIGFDEENYKKLELKLKLQEYEIERLNSIINELEKWCLSWKENDKYCYLASNDKDKCRYDIWEEVLDKLQELKGSDKK